jgi:hypothetical protein
MYHGFLNHTQSPTHRKGGSLDHIFINKSFDESEITNVIPTHYSDYFHIHMVVPWMKLHYDYSTLFILQIYTSITMK